MILELVHSIMEFKHSNLHDEGLPSGASVGERDRLAIIARLNELTEQHKDALLYWLISWLNQNAPQYQDRAKDVLRAFTEDCMRRIIEERCWYNPLNWGILKKELEDYLALTITRKSF